MKKLFILTIILGTFTLSAQVANRTETDCAQNSRSIHQVLGEGKVLIIASKGLDCSICMGDAPKLETFAGQNTATVEIWGAMTLRYGGSTPSCNQVNSWVNTYNWQNIFAFVDQSRYYYSQGTPRYYVYDPRDSSEAYNGFSWNSAKSTAEGITNALSSEEILEIQNIEVFTYDNILVLDGETSYNADIRLIDLSGKTLFSTQLNSLNGREEINLSAYNNGVYLVSVSYGNEVITKKILLN